MAVTFSICFKDRKSVMLGVWAAPEAPETLPKGGGLRTDFRPLNQLKFRPKVQPRLAPQTIARNAISWTEVQASEVRAPTFFCESARLPESVLHAATTQLQNAIP